MASAATATLTIDTAYNATIKFENHIPNNIIDYLRNFLLNNNSIEYITSEITDYISFEILKPAELIEIFYSLTSIFGIFCKIKKLLLTIPDPPEIETRLCDAEVIREQGGPHLIQAEFVFY